MRFDDLRLMSAISAIRGKIDNPGSDRFLEDREEGIKLTKMICAEMITEPDHVLIKEFIRFRKRGDKADLMAELFRRFGARCFYAGRVDTPCCDEVEIDRLNPGGEYVLSNCVLACRTHNNERRDTPLLQYLGQE